MPLRGASRLCRASPGLGVDAGLAERVLANLARQCDQVQPPRRRRGEGERSRRRAPKRSSCRSATAGPASRPRSARGSSRGSRRGLGLERGKALGLAFCRLAVEASGGRIWLEERPGPGAHFTFTLPVAPAQPELRRLEERRYGQPVAPALAEADLAGAASGVRERLSRFVRERT